LLATQLHAKGVGTVVITLGSDGALVHDAAGPHTVPAARPAAVVDTTGAGDAFTAALAVELAAGESIDSAVRFAARAGAHTVSVHEVIPALPRRSDLVTTTREPDPVPGRP
jgi:ribokinase